MTEKSVIRFFPDGINHAGLGPMADVPASEIESGSPVQRGTEFFSDPAIGLVSGVWDCTPYTSKMAPYPVNEFMIVLEGSVTIEEASGHSTTIRAGQGFIIPKGLACKWRQSEYIKKYYVIFDDPSGVDAARASAMETLRIDPSLPREPSDPPPAALLVGPVPRQSGRQWFEDATGQWTVGVWDSTPYRRKAVPFARHELMHLLDGSVTLSNPDTGWSETFRAGDTFFVPLGANVEWLSTEYVRKYYCIMIPAK